MVLNIFALLFVLGITFVHSLYGLFSGLIDVFCSIMALCVAFGFAEPLNDVLTGSLHLPSGYSDAASLGLLFIVTLGILRTAADGLIRGNVRVPMYVDWGGGAVCGFVHAQICVGMMVLSFLLLPWGGRVMMFERTERDADQEMDGSTGRVVFHERNLWLRSDRFAAGLFDLLSNGSLRSEATFASVYPDYPEWVFWTGNQVQSESLPSPVRDERMDGFANGLAVDSWWRQTTGLDAAYTRYRKRFPSRDFVKSSSGNVDPKVNLPPLEPMAYKVQPGNELIGVRIALNSASADREKEGGMHRFRPTNIRLVGDVVEPDGTRVPRQFSAQVIGGGDPLVAADLRIVDVDANFSVISTGNNKLDAYFEVPQGFEPRFIEYRRHARAAVTAAQRKDAAPEDRLSAPMLDSAGQVVASGASRFIDTVIMANSGDKDTLPFRMSPSKLGGDVEVRDQSLVAVNPGSRISNSRPQLESGQDLIDKFQVPSGMRLFQIQAKTRQMESLPGQVMNFVGSITNQYRAVAKGGNSYMLAGYYALVQKDNQPYIQMYYNPNPEETGSRGMLELDQDIRRLLREQDTAILGLIFVVPAGTCIEAIDTGGGRIEFGQEMCVKAGP